MTNCQKYIKIATTSAYMAVCSMLFLIPTDKPRRMPVNEPKQVQAMEVASPTPTPTVEPIMPIILPVEKYLTDAGASNRSKGLEIITAKWSGDNVTAFDNIIKKESGWRADAVNEIGACGIGQALPCEKMGCSLEDLECQVNWVDRYIVSRYGTPLNAWSFWLANNWY